MRASVVIPTLGRPELLRRCLRALAQSEVSAPTDFEIIVADDGASLATRDWVEVEAEARNSRLNMRWVPVTRTHGPAAARNVGWRAAQGDIIAFTDDDTMPDAAWLETGTRALETDPWAVAAWGRLEMPLPPNPTDYELNASNLSGAEFITANCFCRRTALEAVGGFDERFRMAWREDSDLHFSLLKQFPESGRVIHVPEALVIHPIRPAPWGISLKQARKAMFNALLYKKHPEHYRAKIQSAPPWRYYASLAAAALALIGAARDSKRAALTGGAAWLALTADFTARRLRGTSRQRAHVAEMWITSALLPPVAIGWRLYGSWRFKVPFL